MNNEEKTPSIIEMEIQKFIDAIRPEEEEIRKKLDFTYTLEKNVFTLYEVRPDWTDASVYKKYACARARFIKTTGKWRMFWLRASGKWEHFKPYPDTKSFQEVLINIGEDKYGAFFG